MQKTISFFSEKSQSFIDTGDFFLTILLPTKILIKKRKGMFWLTGFMVVSLV
jgi:hypothetical protein